MAFDSIGGLYDVIDKAGRVFSTGTAEQAETASFLSDLHTWVDTADRVAIHSLLPLAVTCLIFHELWTATQENRAFRVGWVGFRIIGFSALLLGYNHVVGALTGIVGGGGDWPSADTILGGVTRAGETRLAMLKAETLEELPDFLFWILLFFFDVLTAFFAVAVATILAKFQSVMIIIFISAGKTCIVLSIIPGVGIAKSWAKALATTAAWGWMGGLVFSAVNQSVGVGDMFQHSASLNVTWHIFVWLYFVTLGVFTMSIPKFVGALTSGAVSGAPSLGGAVGAMFIAKKVADSALKTVGGAAKGALGVGKAARGGDKEGGRSVGGVHRAAGKVAWQAKEMGGAAASAAGGVADKGKQARGGALPKSVRGDGPKKQDGSGQGGGAPSPAASGSPAAAASKKLGGSAANDPKRPAGQQGGSATGGAPGAPVLPAAAGQPAVQGPSSALAASGKQRHAQPGEASSPGAAPSSPSRQEHAAGAASPATQASESRSSSSPTSSSVDAEFAKPSPASVGQPAVARGDGASATARPQATERPQGEPGGRGASPSDVECHPAPNRGRPSRKQDR